MATFSEALVDKQGSSLKAILIEKVLGLYYLKQEYIPLKKRLEMDMMS